MADSSGDLLLLILDLTFWDAKLSSHQENTPVTVIGQVLEFANAYTSFSSQNHLVVFALHYGQSHVVFSNLEASTGSSQIPSAAIYKTLTTLASGSHSSDGPGFTTATQQDLPLSAALSRSMCLIQRWQKHPSRARLRSQPRVLCLINSPDAPNQYIPVMNAIFSAQRANVTIDALTLEPHDSSFLQQAAHITGGLYFKVKKSAALSQYLYSYFLTDTETRELLQITQAVGVDFRASCFCHKKKINDGHVCSVCLSIFCEPRTNCSTCGAVFEH